MNRIIATIASAFLVAITASPIELDVDIPLPPKVLSVQETIVKYATVYAAPEKELMVVAFCESGYNPKAVGDGGRARNIYQFHKPTFDSFSRLMGEHLDYNSYNDQTKLAAFIFANYPQYKNHWTCWTKNFS